MKEQVILDRLKEEGFSNLRTFSIEPDNPDADTIVFVTGCSMSEFKDGVNRLTGTKYIYPYSEKRYIVNSSASAAIELLDRGIRTVIHVKESEIELMASLLSMHPRADCAHVVSGNLSTIEFVENLYQKVHMLVKERPVAKIFLLPYNSFAGNVPHPFTPFGTDDMSLISDIVEARVRLFYFINLMAYDLLLNKGQKEMRMVTLTALASKRASSHLLTDTLHKVISNVFLETLAYEMPYYTGKDVYIIEIAPGIVDTGLYDTEKTREYVLKEAELDGFPFDEKVKVEDFETFPMMSALDVAKVAVRYLFVDKDTDINSGLDESIRRCLTAGRDYKDLKELISMSIVSSVDSIRIDKLLPSYVYVPNSEYGRLPRLRTGYTPVMMCPPGQLF